ncbi:MAG: polyhydroxyalkanoate synthesis repressor PhaR [Pseudomonadota bacterium]
MAAQRKADKNGDGPIIIKKYANRRLYNTAKSSYVTLEDLSEMVRAGKDFAVFDAKTGDDITRTVLTQIIVEEEGKDQNMLPTNFLREIIKLYGDPLQGMVPGYLDASMQNFAKNQEQLRNAFATGNPMQGFEALTRQNMEWFEGAMRMFTPFGGGAPEKKSTEAEDKANDLEALQQQLADVQEQLEKLSKGGK